NAPGGDGFFAEHGNVGRQLFEASFDDGLGALVGDGDEGAVVLCLCVEAGVAHRDDLAPGSEREGDEVIEVQFPLPVRGGVRAGVKRGSLRLVALRLKWRERRFSPPPAPSPRGEGEALVFDGFIVSGLTNGARASPACPVRWRAVR